MTQADLVLLHAPSVYDFRRESILYGPISDVVPSMPIFEMYPVGFTSMASYLEKHDYRVRIINLAHRMLRSTGFDPAKEIAGVRPRVFGIDLHWLPHAQGALAVAQLCKQIHPDIPVLLGGFSSTYYHEELIERPEIDYILRGDSTEEPLLQLMRELGNGGLLHDIPNLTWKDAAGSHVNPLSYVPEDLGAFAIDYGYVMHSVVRYRDLMGVIPFLGWMDYPITTALTCKGCLNTCNTCGGSAFTSRRFYGRTRAAFRDPVDLAKDVHRIAEFSHGPVFVLGDLRQAGRGLDRFEPRIQKRALPGRRDGPGAEKGNILTDGLQHPLVTEQSADLSADHFTFPGHGCVQRLNIVGRCQADNIEQFIRSQL